jgi:hypothetical protein
MFGGLPTVAEVQFTSFLSNDAAIITGYLGTNQNINLPDTVNGYPVTGIQAGAFTGCSCLTNVTIPAGVVRIGDLAFANCTNLIQICFLGDPPALGGPSVFANDTNATICYLASLTSWGSQYGGLQSLPWWPTATLQSQFAYTNVNGTITITSFFGTNWFVVVPGIVNGVRVTSIGSFAFNYQLGVNTVVIPSTVTNIGPWAFSQCGALLAVCCEGDAPACDSSAFAFTYSAVVYHYLGTMGWASRYLTIPTGLWSLQGVCAYSTNKGFATITNYMGGDRSVYLPDVIAGFPVASIATNAFKNKGILISIRLPNGVTVIGTNSFSGCANLVRVTLGTNVAYIGSYAFAYCSSLSCLTVPSSVTNIGPCAFTQCASLTNLYFKGNAPAVDASSFSGITNVTVCYQPGTSGWSAFASKAGVRAVLWNPQAQTGDGNFGLHANKFGFNITGASNLVIVVESSADPANPVWTPLSTNILTAGTCYFSDPQWTNYPNRYYRLRSP